MSEIVQVALEDVPTDAVLAADLRDDQGRILLAVGALLSEAKVAVLRRRGIALVPITASEVLSSDEIQKRRGEVEVLLRQKFSLASETPVMTQLYRTLLAYRLTRLQ